MKNGFTASNDRNGSGGPQGRNDPSPAGWVRLLAGILGLGIATAALWWSGRAMPGPNSFDHQGVTAWLGTSDPVVAAFAVVRLAGLILAGWVVLTGSIALVVHRSRLRRIRWVRRLVDRLCLPVVRRLVHGVAGAALATATLAPGAAGALDAATMSTVPTRGEVAALVALEPTAGPSTAPSASPTSTDGGVSADRAVIIGPPPSAPPTSPTSAMSPTTSGPIGATAPAPPSSPAAPPPRGAPAHRSDGGTSAPPPSLATQPRNWRIEPGQHLWHVAASTLAEHLGATPDDETVAVYLTAVIEANRDRLVVPTNPDLVFAGQELLLPPLTLEQ